MTMKTGLSAFVYRLLQGEQTKNFCCANGLSGSLSSVLYNGRYQRLFSYQCHGLLQRPRTFSSCNEDDFEELGPPSEGLPTQFKLMTQKPELHVRNGQTKKLNRSQTSISSISPGFKKVSKPSRPILQVLDNLYGKDGDMRNHSKVDSRSVKAEDMTTNGVDDRNSDFKRNGQTKKLNRSQPSISSISPGFKKVSKPSKPILQDRDNLNGKDGDMKNHSKVDSCSVKAEDMTTNGVDDRNSDVKIVTIRIKDIAKATSYHNIHSICKTAGVLEGLAKSEDYIDVFFRVNNDADSQNILKRLNSTVIDESNWSANELLENSSEASSSSEDDRYKTVGLEINDVLFEMKQQMAYKRMLCEDLELLHLSVMHLQGLPTVSRSIQ